MITILLAALALTDAQQVKHDAEERTIYAMVQADQSRIDEIWRPKPHLLSDMRAARRYYRDFHLYKVEGCATELERVDKDLAGFNTEDAQ